jgi:CDP-paratose 2-epimerase
MPRILITGGAGFIGVHATKAFSEQGWTVTIADNFHRKGTKINLEWLQEGCRFDFKKLDIRNSEAVEELIRKSQPDVILHLAAQVAVTTSTENPREDFEINACGTFNLLDAVRRFSKHSLFINASTNKVYGRLDEIPIVQKNERYTFTDLPLGVSESCPLDFHSPYGCSKGAADQYTLDYARIYGIRSTSFRQSCIYGTRQFGVEDQGWIAWFTIAAALGREIRIFGNGKQTRDVLYIDDLICAYVTAVQSPDLVAGQAFNIGGGPDNTLSLMELISHLETVFEKKIRMRFEEERPGDQPVFICDISKSKKILGWTPLVHKEIGIDRLIRWVVSNKELVESLSP